LCGVVLLGGSSLLDINQLLMEIEVKRPQGFCYKQLSLVVWFVFASAFTFGFGLQMFLTLRGRMLEGVGYVCLKDELFELHYASLESYSLTIGVGVCDWVDDEDY